MGEHVVGRQEFREKEEVARDKRRKYPRKMKFKDVGKIPECWEDSRMFGKYQNKDLQTFLSNKTNSV